MILLMGFTVKFQLLLHESATKTFTFVQIQVLFLRNFENVPSCFCVCEARAGAEMSYDRH